jgi:phosphate-selective porin
MNAAHDREMRALKGEVRSLKHALTVRDQQSAASRGGTAGAVARLGDKPGPTAHCASIGKAAYEWGPEFGFRWRNFLLQGECIQIGVDRSVTNSFDNPHLKFTGSYVEAAWTLTGEPRLYKPYLAAFDTPISAHPLSQSRGDWGAFELAGRYSVVDLNAGAAVGIPQSVTGGVYGGKQ